MAGQLTIYFGSVSRAIDFWDAMKLWLVCFLVLFFGAEAVQWFSHLPWMSGVELSLPLTVMGGIVLAIASNHGALFGRDRPTFGPPPAQPETPPLPNSPLPPPNPKVATPVRGEKANRKVDTISFEIKKPQTKR